MASQTYNLDGATDFPFPFRVRTASILTVEVRPGGVIPPTQYEVIGAGPNSTGVTVRWRNAPTDPELQLVITRYAPPSRVTVFQTGNVTPQALNAEFDNAYEALLDTLSTFGEWRGEWEPDELYLPLNVVVEPVSGNVYVALEQHVSGPDFATDLDARRWRLVIDYETLNHVVLDARDDTFDARDVALAARDAAEEARDAAQFAQNAAENAQTGAETAQSLAEIAQAGAEAAEDGAEAARDRAEEWAENPEDVPVLPGQFSALHWAQKAQEFSEGAAENITFDPAQSVLTATNVQEALEELGTSATIDLELPGGRGVLRAGHYGLGETIVEEPGHGDASAQRGSWPTDDLNSLGVPSGIYWVHTTTVPSGSPAGACFVLHRQGDIVGFQLAVAVDAPRVFFRRQLGTWGSWFDMTPMGVGQSWQDVTASRAVATTYTNTTGMPIQIFITFDPNGGGPHFLIDGVNILPGNDSAYYHVACIVPPGATYQLPGAGGGVQLRWMELR